MCMQDHHYRGYGAKFSKQSTINQNGIIFEKYFEMDDKLFITGIKPGDSPTYWIQEAYLKGEFKYLQL